MNQLSEQQAVDDEISLLDLLQVIVENLRLLVFGPLLVGLFALGVAFILPPVFTAKAVFLPPQQQQSAAASMLASLGSLGGLAGAAGLKNPTDQYVAFLKSNTIKDALIDRFKLIERFEVRLRSDARLQLDSIVRISAGKDGLMSIEVDDIDAGFASALANAYIEELRVLLAKLAVTEAQQRRVFFEKQLNQTKENLAKAETLLRSTGVSDRALKSNPASAVAAVAALKAQVTAQEVKLGAMRGYLADSSPEFKLALAELASLRSQLTKLERDDSGPGKSADVDYVNRYRDFKYHETLFELFAKQYEIARVDEAREGAVIQVLDAAQVPERKSKPKRALIAVIATLAAGFALLLLVFLRQAYRNASRSNDNAAKIESLTRAWSRAIGRRGVS
jgi:tyrosine-protein kinase Etk/Wzc